MCQAMYLLMHFCTQRYIKYISHLGIIFKIGNWPLVGLTVIHQLFHIQIYASWQCFFFCFSKSFNLKVVEINQLWNIDKDTCPTRCYQDFEDVRSVFPFLGRDGNTKMDSTENYLFISSFFSSNPNELWNLFIRKMNKLCLWLEKTVTPVHTYFMSWYA